MLIALPALVTATSCVPQQPVRTAAAQAHVQPPAPLLLKQLDLKIPSDLAASTLPAGLDTFPALTVVPAAPPFLAATRSGDDAARAIECLTAAVYYEARSESIEGQRAVAQVVLNRVRDRAFPASVCGVVYQGSSRRAGCQFSFTCDGSLYHPREPLAWARARVIATTALAGAVYAPVGSATFYHANYVSPWWAGSMTHLATIGAHVFYRWKSGMEKALAFTQSYSGVEPLAGGSWAGAAPAQVDVHYASEIVSGVTIHRPETAATAAVAAHEPAVTPPPEAMSAGVRIHRRSSAVPADAVANPDDATT